ncbi:MAG TPA: class II aldolase/adducin family protein [Micromonosporaceae bacterium]
MNYVGGDLRDQLANVGYDVVRAGLVVGSGGNLSAREPGEDVCWVTAAGTWLDRLERPSFVKVNISTGSPVPDGLDLAGRRVPPPTTELALHLATYQARPNVNAIVHLHPQTVVLLDALGERIRLVTTDHAAYLRTVVTTPFHPPGTPELAAAAAGAAAGGADCIVLAHHGCSVLGDGVEMAHRRARNLEEAAQMTYRAYAIGALATLPECPAEFVDGLSNDPSIAV